MPRWHWPRSKSCRTNSGERRSNPRRSGKRQLAGTIAIGHARVRPENPARRRAQCRPAQKPCAKRWRKISRRQSATLVLGVLQDKDWRHICETLAPLAARIFTVPVASERTADRANWRRPAARRIPRLKLPPAHSLAEALDKSAGDDFVVITGSLYLVGEALELLAFPRPAATNAA